MNTVRPFVKSLAWHERDFSTAFQLHHNRAFQHVKKCMRIVPMNRTRGARRIHYGDHQTFLAGTLRKIFRYERLASCPIKGPAMRDANTGMGRDIFIIAAFTLPGDPSLALVS